MKAYELLFFVAPTLEEEARAKVMGRIENVITEGEGTIDNHEDWGKRVLDVIEEVLVEKTDLTPDLGGTATTAQVGDAVIAKLQKFA